MSLGQVYIESIDGIPLYNGDVEEEQGIPQIVNSLKQKIANSDGIILVSPEYNHSIPGTLKNAIDWLSRPPKDIPQIFANKAVAILGATPSNSGTRFSQVAWLPIFRTLSLVPWSGMEFYLDKADKRFNDEGRLIDEESKKLLKKFVDGFFQFCTSLKGDQNIR